MSQVSVLPATASGRSQWHALRPVLILGGFVAIWWALMTGVAHAEGTPHHGLDSLRASVKAHHPTPVRDLVRRVHHDVKANTAKTTEHVSHQARPVVRTASSIVSSTPIASQATKTVSTTVSETISGTVEKTRNLLHKTTAEPVLEKVDEVAKHTIEKPESSTGQGNSHSLRFSGKASANSSADLLPATTETSGLGSANATGAHRATPSIDGDSPGQSPLGTPTVPGPCASPSGSGSSSITPVGVTESSLLVMPSVLRDHRSWRLARLPGGPAYEPGSSPD